MCWEIEAILPGPSRTITVEPIERPVPAESPDRDREPAREPERERIGDPSEEPVPA
jgi:hypothetical protein